MRVAGFALFLSTFNNFSFRGCQLSRVEITSRETLSDPSVRFSYERIEGYAFYAWPGFEG